MALKHLGVVDAEVGLLLLGDPVTLQLWHGSDSEQTQMARIESAVREGKPGLNVSISNQASAVWDMQGSGSADIFYEEISGEIVIIRCWLDDLESKAEIPAIEDFGMTSADLSIAFAEFEVKTGLLAILCILERGNCIHCTNEFSCFLSDEEMMTSTSGILIPVPKGRYQCFHDELTRKHGQARRCRLVRVMK